MDAKELLTKQYRADCRTSRFMVDRLTRDLSDDELNWQSAPGHHSIWHNLWHAYLANDYYFAGSLGLRAVWDAESWRERFDLSPMARAFEFTGPAFGGPVPHFAIVDVPDSLVDDLRAVPLAEFLAYVDAMQARNCEALDAMPFERLAVRIDSAGRRLPAYAIALNFSHVYRHIGMIEQLRGLLRGPGAGTATV